MPSQWEDRSKPHRNIVFIGHVDHGKSTTVGRLLLDSGHIEAHVIEKNEKLAAESGKAGFGLAYVMDGLKEERERGVGHVAAVARELVQRGHDGSTSGTANGELIRTSRPSKGPIPTRAGTARP